MTPLRRIYVGLALMAGATLVIAIVGAALVFFSARSTEVSPSKVIATPSSSMTSPPKISYPLSNPLPSKMYVEDVLSALGLPVGKVDGVYDVNTQRALCAWRELTYGEPTRALPSDLEAMQIVSTKALAPAANQVVGLNVNIACQTATWVSAAHVVIGVFPVSSGQPGYLSTSVGLWKVEWQVPRWYESILYPEAMMYRPKFFHRGMAIHGSATDALVLPYPASHGCVRMLHADIDRLWDAGFGIGDAVNVYGEWISNTL